MILGFMVYSLMAAAVLGVAALVAERALGSFGLPTRWAWLAALIGGFGLPAVFLAIPWVAADPTAVLGRGAADVLYETTAPIAVDGSWAVMLDAVLLLAWVVSTGLLLAFVVISSLRLVRSKRAWQRAVMAGCPVLVSDDVGPAAFGVSKGRIVMPQWALRADERLQGLMLRHEQEHLRARDPLLLWAVVAILLVMPWNATLWWVAHRLRLALEVDCDRRVLRTAGTDPKAYGDLLLEVGRRAIRQQVFAAAFSWPASSLEHRVRAMTAVSSLRGRLFKVVGAVGVVTASLGLVWVTPNPFFGYCQFETTSKTHVSNRGNQIWMGVQVGQPRVVRTLPPLGG